MPSPTLTPSRFALAAASCLCAFALLGGPARAQLPAFPGAEGAGAYAKGGRGGDVYHVTNLSGSGAGSLAYGIANIPTAGRTIVFDVSGYAHIAVTLRITKNKLTIAGQTAPGDGFALRDGTFLVSSDDVVIRHVRFRDGDSADAIDLDSNSQNSIFDHCDAMFSNDENMSTFNSPPENLTFQWSFNAWGMESHSCGGLWDMSHTTAHHTLWAHNHTRNPKARPGLLDWVNNVTFDWDIGFIMGDSNSNATWRANVRGCYFIGGTSKTVALEKAGLQTSNGLPNFSLYLEGSALDGNVNGVLDVTRSGYSMASGSYTTSATPFPMTANFQAVSGTNPQIGVPVTQDDYLTAYKKIVSAAGPLRLEYDPAKALRDEVDDLLVTELVAQKHHHVSSVAGTGLANGGFGNLNSVTPPVDSDQDGIPDYFETAVGGATLGWSTATDDHNTALLNSGGLVSEPTFMPANTAVGTATLDKYTHLEEYLHFLAIPHAVMGKNTASAPTSIDIDLRKFTRGFTNTQVFTLTNIVNGTATQSGTGGYLVHFVPRTTNFTGTTTPYGRAKFDFKVLDADGSQWTQQFGILVSSAGVPRDLRWKGDAAANAWDAAATNWHKAGEDPLGAANTAFSDSDSALFDDSGSAAPNLALSGSLSPGAVTVDSSKNYTFGGTGALAGAMSLTKAGTGTLTINTSNSITGETAINGGALVMGNAGALGSSGKVSLNGAALTYPSGGGTLSNPLAVNNPSFFTAISTSNIYLNGAVTGSGGLTLNLSNKLLTFQNDWSGYTGTLDTGTSTGTIRINSPTSVNYAGATFNLGNVKWFHHVTALLNMSFGALNGGSASQLAGGDTGVTGSDIYTIGALGLDSTYAGIIADGTGSGHKLAITKIGPGTLTLSGTSTYTGATTLSGSVSAVSVTNGGSGYTSTPTVAFTGGGGTGAAATPTLIGPVASFTITSGGSGYTSAPTVTLSGGGGTGATATATVNSGAVATITVTNGGSGYTSAPTVAFSAAAGSGAAATAILGPKSVSKVTVTASGSGYTAAPTVGFSGGAGSGAAATASVVGGGTLAVSGTLGSTAVNVGTGSLLTVSGAIGGAVTVQSGAALSGNGALNGGLSVQSGATLSPGILAGVAGTLAVGGAVGLNTTTLPFDLSSSPASGNDKITLNGGVLTTTGTQTFQFNLLTGVLGAGVYPLINGGAATSTATPSLAHNLPTGARQSFTFGTGTRGNINLVVSGTAASLIWTGANGSAWNYNNTVNWSGAPETVPNNKFLTLDAVTFNDTASNGTVVIGGVVQPGLITVTNTTRNYSIGGGVIAGTGKLVKNNAGTLTLSVPSATVTSTTTNGSPTVQVNTTGLFAGMTVTGTGIAADTTIALIVDGTHLTLSQNATADGTVSLTYLGINSYSGGTDINGGTITLADDLANTYALGTGPVTFNGGTLSMYNNVSGDNTAAWDLKVPTGAVGTLLADSRVTLSGNLTGGGTLNLRVPYIRTNVIGDWSAFTGIINVTADGDGGDFRYGTNYSYPSFPQAAVVLQDKVSMYFLGIVNAGTGTTIEIGELSGVAGSYLSGGQSSSGGRLFIYRIGGRGTDATFAGTINEQDAAVTNTSFVKTGVGIWTLSGACSYNGSTTVEQGTLRISGSLTSPQALTVQSAATLNLQGGTITVDAVNIAAGATFSGSGTLNADLNNDGTVTAMTGGTITVTGDVVNNGTLRIANGTALTAAAGFVNNGVLDLLTGVSGLPPNLENHGIVIDSTTLRMVAAVKNGSKVTITVPGHSGYSYQLQRSDSLTAPAWTSIVGSVGTGTTQSNGQPTPLQLFDNNATGTQRFYRVQVTPL
ncbi:MAG: hypothetical protein QOE70_2415 [Chthoniobacter sp.]|jgi:autotransporter-associated beta strand protein|nr:hypothetical protein [Chthoniobacter sp.]